MIINVKLLEAGEFRTYFTWCHNVETRGGGAKIFASGGGGGAKIFPSGVGGEAGIQGGWGY